MNADGEAATRRATVPAATDVAAGSVAASDAGLPRMLHLVTRLTEPVAAFVGPATRTLAAQGVSQALVAWDDAGGRALRERLDPRVEVHWVAAGGSRAAALMRMRGAVTAVLSQPGGPPVHALHAHGVQAALVAATLPLAVRGRAVYFSPHASRLLAGAVPLGRPLLLAARGLLGPTTAIAADGADVPGLPVDAAPRRVDAPVARRWFVLPRREAVAPLVVGSAAAEAGDAAVEAFVRLAVLLADGDCGPRFAWVGEVSDDARARLKAAAVRHVAPHDDDGLADVLAQAWVHLALAGGRGLPTVLARAMAAGVPTVAADAPAHRALLAHGRTGLLSAGDDHLLIQLAGLLDRPDWRAALGAAAAAEARRRLDPDAFAHRLLAAYRRLPSPGATAAAAGATA